MVERYIGGREFTVGLLGDKRPRVLPPMEIKFKKDTARPVYDYGVKHNILRSLRAMGCRVTVVPAKTPAAAVLAEVVSPDPQAARVATAARPTSAPPHVTL